MVMPELARRYSVAEVLAFPEDGNRHELIRGELVASPAPSVPHQLVVGELFLRLGQYLEGIGRPCQLFAGPADISWDDEALVQPDLFVVPAGEVTGQWRSIRTLLLAVEVISPSSRRRDQVDKRRLYQARQVPVYWLVDPEADRVEVWHANEERPLIVTDRLRWRAAPHCPEVEIDLASLFARLPARDE